MPVPSTIDQLSTTAASNFPAGSDSPSSLDDVQRAHGSFIATIRDTVGLGTGTLVPATARTNFGAAASGPLASSGITGAAATSEIRSYLAGCTLSTAGSSATMSISAGVAQDSANAATMTLAAISKTTSAWAVGTAAGGLDTGAIANSTWYHFYAIRRPDTGVVDVVFSTSASAPTLPTNYTQYRRIGSAKTNGSAQWVKFTQDGDLFMLSTPVLDASTGTPGTSAFSVALGSVPSGVRVGAVLTASIIETTGVDAMYLSDLSSDDLAPSGTTAPGITVRSYTAGNTGVATVTVMTSTGQSIRARVQVGAATCTVYFITLGWVDTRGRNS